MFKRYLFVIGYGACAMVPIGLLQFVGNYVLPAEFLRDMLAFIFFGAGLGAVLVFSHLLIARVRWRQLHGPAAAVAGGNFRSIDMHQTVVVPRSCQDTYRLCQEFAARFEGATIVKSDPDENGLRLRTARSFGSYGEFIDFRVRPIGDQFAEIELRSHPVERFALLDHGRNLNNLRRVCESLRASSEYVHLGELVALK
jgi:hypothetical protein